MAKSVVSIVKGTDAEKMVAEALSLLGGVSALIKPGSTHHPFKFNTCDHVWKIAITVGVFTRLRVIGFKACGENHGTHIQPCLAGALKILV